LGLLRQSQVFIPEYQEKITRNYLKWLFRSILVHFWGLAGLFFWPKNFLWAHTLVLWPYSKVFSLYGRIPSDDLHSGPPTYWSTNWQKKASYRDTWPHLKNAFSHRSVRIHRWFLWNWGAKKGEAESLRFEPEIFYHLSNCLTRFSNFLGFFSVKKLGFKRLLFKSQPTGFVTWL
jgi:hypothetical protein